MKSLMILMFSAASLIHLNGFVDSAPTKSGKRLKLKIIKILPCTSQATPTEKIRFPTLDQSALTPDASKGEGCYSIRAPVHVSQPVSGDVQMYSEVQFGTRGKPEPCHKADSNNCGGVGSCVYCDVCNNAKNIDSTSRGLVRLDSTDGSTFDCKAGLQPGDYNNMRIDFCLPTEDDVESEMGDDLINRYLDEGSLFSVTLKITQDQRINTWSPVDLQQISYNKVIGCLKFVGTVYSDD